METGEAWRKGLIYPDWGRFRTRLRLSLTQACCYCSFTDELLPRGCATYVVFLWRVLFPVLPATFEGEGQSSIVRRRFCFLLFFFPSKFNASTLI
jgi:hypothetical protein